MLKTLNCPGCKGCHIKCFMNHQRKLGLYKHTQLIGRKASYSHPGTPVIYVSFIQCRICPFRNASEDCESKNPSPNLKSMQIPLSSEAPERIMVMYVLSLIKKEDKPAKWERWYFYGDSFACASRHSFSPCMAGSKYKEHGCVLP